MSEKLLEFLSDNNIDFKEQSDSVILSCPFCDKDKLYIRKDELNFICFHCAGSNDDAKGPNCSKILENITGTPAATIRGKLSDFTSISEFKLHLEEPKIVKKTVTSTAFEFPSNFYRITTNAAIPGLRYLESRGMTKDLAASLDIRYSVQHKSVIFPIYHNKEIVGYQGRSVDPECPKEYQKLTSKGLKKSNYLMFSQTVNSDQVVMAEGPISAAKFANAGIGFVATMGKYVSDSQMELLLSLGITTIFLALDDDAYRETEALMKKYAGQFTFRQVHLTKEALARIDKEKADFGDCTFEECNDAIKESVPYNRQQTRLTNIVKRLHATNY